MFATLLGAEDAVISDALNHASIIDGVRLCRARRYRYRNNDMADLEAQLQAAEAAQARFKLITTDGVFSMDGYIARLDEICDLAERYDALVHFDDCHATGFLGDYIEKGIFEYRLLLTGEKVTPDMVQYHSGDIGPLISEPCWIVVMNVRSKGDLGHIEISFISIETKSIINSGGCD